MIAMLFTPNCSGLLAFALGVILTSAPKPVPSEGSVPCQMGLFYKISCISMILSNTCNLIDCKSSFSSPKLSIWFFFPRLSWDFPGGSVVRILLFHCRDTDWILGQGTKIHNTSRYRQNKTDEKRGQSETETLKQIITIKIIFKKRFVFSIIFPYTF